MIYSNLKIVTLKSKNLLDEHIFNYILNINFGFVHTYSDYTQDDQFLVFPAVKMKIGCSVCC